MSQGLFYRCMCNNHFWLTEQLQKNIYSLFKTFILKICKAYLDLMKLSLKHKNNEIYSPPATHTQHLSKHGASTNNRDLQVQH